MATITVFYADIPSLYAGTSALLRGGRRHKRVKKREGRFFFSFFTYRLFFDIFLYADLIAEVMFVFLFKFIKLELFNHACL